MNCVINALDSVVAFLMSLWGNTHQQYQNFGYLAVK